MEDKPKPDLEGRRGFLKAIDWSRWGHLETDQQKGIPLPPFQKPHPADAGLVRLVPPDELTVGKTPMLEVINKRRSRRKFTDEALTNEELSFLLWATQGYRRDVNGWSFRTVPSAGSRHSFETYLHVVQVERIDPGLYRFLPKEHKLVFLTGEEGLEERVNEALYGQRFNAAVTFIWTTLPYRMEWRYSVASVKAIAIDAGHVGQNLYLAAEAINCGTCAIGAYDQGKMDALLGVDGGDEFTIYAAPVGKPAEKDIDTLQRHGIDQAQTSEE
ncbi:SagB/ThcOx family dehydrogenase [bacterium]|nr:SagB/ThcOx family dehydrogenase [bacterium]